mmetsp:Transcript_3803/g.10817  ORF Transcript_3803/g.10817 Transcript_3803/m.10817 type:complete len:272 (+) Transcript_3803:1826-2641(+)
MTRVHLALWARATRAPAGPLTAPTSASSPRVSTHLSWQRHRLRGGRLAAPPGMTWTHAARSQPSPHRWCSTSRTCAVTLWTHRCHHPRRCHSSSSVRWMEGLRSLWRTSARRWRRCRRRCSRRWSGSSTLRTRTCTRWSKCRCKRRSSSSSRPRPWRTRSTSSSSTAGSTCTPPRRSTSTISMPRCRHTPRLQCMRTPRRRCRRSTCRAARRILRLRQRSCRRCDTQLLLLSTVPPLFGCRGSWPYPDTRQPLLGSHCSWPYPDTRQDHPR